MKAASLALVTVAMLAVLAAPIAQAVTVYNVDVTVTANGQTSTSQVRILDRDDDGIVSADVSDDMLAKIQGTFGTTSFVFPGSYTGTFNVGTTTVTVTVQSDDNFVLNFV